MMKCDSCKQKMCNELGDYEGYAICTAPVGTELNLILCRPCYQLRIWPAIYAAVKGEQHDRSKVRDVQTMNRAYHTLEQLAVHNPIVNAVLKMHHRGMPLLQCLVEAVEVMSRSVMSQDQNRAAQRGNAEMMRYTEPSIKLLGPNEELAHSQPEPPAPDQPSGWRERAPLL
jgi:hypothetical protein